MSNLFEGLARVCWHTAIVCLILAVFAAPLGSLKADDGDVGVALNPPGCVLYSCPISVPCFYNHAGDALCTLGGIGARQCPCFRGGLFTSFCFCW
jgi:hypothetical protein